jgi:ornithine--oxo-acid transaminase
LIIAAERVGVAFDDLDALERALAGRDVAAFFVEPIQGKGVNIPQEGYLLGAQALCRKYGTLFVADEIQTGVGRTGRFFAIDHFPGVEPDMIVVAKALSGGHVPVGAVLTRKWIFDKVFDRMDRAVVHGSTFAGQSLHGGQRGDAGRAEMSGSSRMRPRRRSSARIVQRMAGSYDIADVAQQGPRSESSSGRRSRSN